MEYLSLDEYRFICIYTDMEDADTLVQFTGHIWAVWSYGTRYDQKYEDLRYSLLGCSYMGIHGTE